MNRKEQNTLMKKGKIGAVVLAVALFATVIGCAFCMERIPAGYVGVVYSMNGGVQNELLTQGFHLIAPTKSVKEFTVGNEQLVLSKDSRDGSEADESFLVSTADNANISISVQMSYRFKQDEVVDTYKKFRGMSGADIISSRVRTILKAKISEVTTNYTMMDIYSGDRGKINKEITQFLSEKLGDEFGIEVIDASIIDVHPDAQLQQTINDRVTAMQRKQQAQAEQETIVVQNQTKILQAEAAAKSKEIAAAAEAKANTIISNSISDQLLKKMEMEARQEHGWVTIQGGSVITTNSAQPQN